MTSTTDDIDFVTGDCCPDFLRNIPIPSDHPINSKHIGAIDHNEATNNIYAIKECVDNDTCDFESYRTDLTAFDACKYDKKYGEGYTRRGSIITTYASFNDVPCSANSLYGNIDTKYNELTTSIDSAIVHPTNNTLHDRQIRYHRGSSDHNKLLEIHALSQPGCCPSFLKEMEPPINSYVDGKKVKRSYRYNQYDNDKLSRNELIYMYVCKDPDNNCGYNLDGSAWDHCKWNNRDYWSSNDIDRDTYKRGYFWRRKCNDGSDSRMDNTDGVIRLYDSMKSKLTDKQGELTTLQTKSDGKMAQSDAQDAIKAQELITCKGELTTLQTKSDGKMAQSDAQDAIKAQELIDCNADKDIYLGMVKPFIEQNINNFDNITGRCCPAFLEDIALTEGHPLFGKKKDTSITIPPSIIEVYNEDPPPSSNSKLLTAYDACRIEQGFLTNVTTTKTTTGYWTSNTACTTDNQGDLSNTFTSAIADFQPSHSKLNEFSENCCPSYLKSMDVKSNHYLKDKKVLYKVNSGTYTENSYPNELILCDKKDANCGPIFNYDDKYDQSGYHVSNAWDSCIYDKRTNNTLDNITEIPEYPSNLINEKRVYNIPAKCDKSVLQEFDTDLYTDYTNKTNELDMVTGMIKPVMESNFAYTNNVYKNANISGKCCPELLKDIPLTGGSNSTKHRVIEGTTDTSFQYYDTGKPIPSGVNVVPFSAWELCKILNGISSTINSTTGLKQWTQFPENTCITSGLSDFNTQLLQNEVSASTASGADFMAQHGNKLGQTDLDDTRYAGYLATCENNLQQESNDFKSYMGNNWDKIGHSDSDYRILEGQLQQESSDFKSYMATNWNKLGSSDTDDTILQGHLTTCETDKNLYKPNHDLLENNRDNCCPSYLRDRPLTDSSKDLYGTKILRMSANSKPYNIDKLTDIRICKFTDNSCPPVNNLNADPNGYINPTEFDQCKYEHSISKNELDRIQKSAPGAYNKYNPRIGSFNDSKCNNLFENVDKQLYSDYSSLSTEYINKGHQYSNDTCCPLELKHLPPPAGSIFENKKVKTNWRSDGTPSHIVLCKNETCDNELAPVAERRDATAYHDCIWDKNYTEPTDPTSYASRHTLNTGNYAERYYRYSDNCSLINNITNHIEITEDALEQESSDFKSYMSNNWNKLGHSDSDYRILQGELEQESTNFKLYMGDNWDRIDKSDSDYRILQGELEQESTNFKLYMGDNWDRIDKSDSDYRILQESLEQESSDFKSYMATNWNRIDKSNDDDTLLNQYLSSCEIELNHLKDQVECCPDHLKTQSITDINHPLYNAYARESTNSDGDVLDLCLYNDSHCRENDILTIPGYRPTTAHDACRYDYTDYYDGDDSQLNNIHTGKRRGRYRMSNFKECNYLSTCEANLQQESRNFSSYMETNWNKLGHSDSDYRILQGELEQESSNFKLYMGDNWDRIDKSDSDYRILQESLEQESSDFKSYMSNNWNKLGHSDSDYRILQESLEQESSDFKSYIDDNWNKLGHSDSDYRILQGELEQESTNFKLYMGDNWNKLGHSDSDYRILQGELEQESTNFKSYIGDNWDRIDKSDSDYRILQGELEQESTNFKSYMGNNWDRINKSDSDYRILQESLEQESSDFKSYMSNNWNKLGHSDSDYKILQGELEQESTNFKSYIGDNWDRIDKSDSDYRILQDSLEQESSNFKSYMGDNRDRINKSDSDYRILQESLEQESSNFKSYMDDNRDRIDKSDSDYRILQDSLEQESSNFKSYMGDNRDRINKSDSDYRILQESLEQESSDFKSYMGNRIGQSDVNYSVLQGQLEQESSDFKSYMATNWDRIGQSDVDYSVLQGQLEQESSDFKSYMATNWDRIGNSNADDRVLQSYLSSCETDLEIKSSAYSTLLSSTGSSYSDIFSKLITCEDDRDDYKSYNDYVNQDCCPRYLRNLLPRTNHPLNGRKVLRMSDFGTNYSYDNVKRMLVCKRDDNNCISNLPGSYPDPDGYVDSNAYDACIYDNALYINEGDANAYNLTTIPEKNKCSESLFQRVDSVLYNEKENELEDEILAYQSLLDLSEGKLDSSDTSYLQLQGYLTSCETLRDELQDDLDDEIDTNKNLQGNYSTCQTTRNNYQTQRNNCRTHRDLIIDERDDYNILYNTLYEQTTSEIGSQGAQNAILSHNLIMCEDSLEDTNDTLDTCVTNRNTYQTQRNSCNNNLTLCETDLEQESSDFKSYMGNNWNRIGYSNEDYNALQDNLINTQGNLTTCETDLEQESSDFKSYMSTNWDRIDKSDVDDTILQGQLSTCQDDLEQESSDYKSYMGNNWYRIQNSNADYSTLQGQLEQESSDFKSYMGDNWDRIQNSNADYSTLQGQLEQESSDFKSYMGDNWDRIDKSDADDTILQGQLVSCQDDLEQESSDFKSYMSTNWDRIDKSNDDDTILQGELSTCQDNLEQESSDYKSYMANNWNRIDRSDVDDTILRGHLTTCETNYSKKSTDYNNLHNNFTTSQGHLTTCETDLQQESNDYSTYMADNWDRINESDADYAELHSNFTTCETDFTTYIGTNWDRIHRSDADDRVLRGHLSTCETDYTNKSTDYNNKVIDYDNLHNTFTTCEENYTNKSTDYDNKVDDFNTLHGRFTTCEDERDDLELERNLYGRQKDSYKVDRNHCYDEYNALDLLYGNLSRASTDDLNDYAGLQTSLVLNQQNYSKQIKAKNTKYNTLMEEFDNCNDDLNPIGRAYIVPTTMLGTDDNNCRNFKGCFNKTGNDALLISDVHPNKLSYEECFNYAKSKSNNKYYSITDWDTSINKGTCTVWSDDRYRNSYSRTSDTNCLIDPISNKRVGTKNHTIYRINNVCCDDSDCTYEQQNPETTENFSEKYNKLIMFIIFLIFLVTIFFIFKK
jgi:hypothetical protein